MSSPSSGGTFLKLFLNQAANPEILYTIFAPDKAIRFLIEVFPLTSLTTVTSRYPTCMTRISFFLPEEKRVAL
jgi:hypothetical protein